MPITLRQADADFEQRFQAFLASKREDSPEVDQTVRQIIADVRQRGDVALKELTKKFDRADLDQIGMRVTPDDIAASYGQASSETIDALKFARDRIVAHHRRQMPKDDRYTDPIGVELGSRWTAVESVGLYVPGG
jgi:histidinol dehydrogenase